MESDYELDDLDRDLLQKCRVGVGYLENGDPLKDVLDQDEIEDAIRLLIKITTTWR